MGRALNFLPGTYDEAYKTAIAENATKNALQLISPVHHVQ